MDCYRYPERRVLLLVTSVFSWISDFVQPDANCDGACRSGVRVVVP
jgi:hypothetical protein